MRDTLLKAGEGDNGVAAGALFLQEIKKLTGSAKETEDNKSADVEEESKGNSTISADAIVPPAPGVDKAGDFTIIPKLAVFQDFVTNLVQLKLTSAKSEDPASYADTPWDWGSCDGICGRDMSKYNQGV